MALLMALLKALLMALLKALLNALLMALLKATYMLSLRLLDAYNKSTNPLTHVYLEAVPSAGPVVPAGGLLANHGAVRAVLDVARRPSGANGGGGVRRHAGGGPGDPGAVAGP
eukprot:1184727-Prorocentrum_minimum.AAC.2